MKYFENLKYLFIIKTWLYQFKGIHFGTANAEVMRARDKRLIIGPIDMLPLFHIICLDDVNSPHKMSLTYTSIYATKT